MNLVSVEKHFTFEYKGKSYNARTIDDYEYGEFETIVTADNGTLLSGKKEKEVLNYFLNHKHEAE